MLPLYLPEARLGIMAKYTQRPIVVAEYKVDLRLFAFLSTNRFYHR